ncbi:MAG TPA: carboxypeptidase-like regulatory domain-containing protein, partial [Sphingobacteriaceae bacterium]
MKKSLLIALTAILLPFLAAAQFSISGKVTEKNSDQVLTGASVSINDSRLTNTNGEGEFTFTNVKPQSYRLKVSYIGYKTFEQTLDVSANTTLNITLEKSSYLAEEVIVRSTRASENTATTFKNLNKSDLEKNNLGQDLP